ncbi:MAG: hypothetical protein GXX78_02435 [Bacteroidales bacterium]|nr:hypothetical protein [Bacteroidales bacterium]
MKLVSNILRNSTFSIAPFELEMGTIILLFISVGKDVKVCENKEIGFIVKQKPYWVEFDLHVNDEEAVKVINDNIEYLSPFLSQQNKHVSKDILHTLSGMDVRLINMFIKRKVENENFFEINTAGIGTTSIKFMFDFLISEIKDSNFNVSYMVIEPNEKVKRINPIFISENNIEEIFISIY